MNTLKDIKTGETARVEKLGGDGALRQHFLDMDNRCKICAYGRSG